MRQRRRWLVLVLGIVLLAAILATGFAIEAARERNAAKLAEADAIKHQEISDAVSRYFVHATAGAANPYAVGQKDMTVREMLQASSEKVHETVGDVPEVEMIVRSELSNAFASFADFTRATEQAELGLAIAKRTSIACNGASGKPIDASLRPSRNPICRRCRRNICAQCMPTFCSTSDGMATACRKSTRSWRWSISAKN